MMRRIFIYLLLLFTMSSCYTSAEVVDEEIYGGSNVTLSVVLTDGVPYYYNGSLWYYYYHDYYYYPVYYHDYWYLTRHHVKYPYGYDFRFVPKPYHDRWRFRPGSHGYGKPGLGHDGRPRNRGGGHERPHFDRPTGHHGGGHGNVGRSRDRRGSGGDMHPTRPRPNGGMTRTRPSTGASRPNVSHGGSRPSVGAQSHNRQSSRSMGARRH